MSRGASGRTIRKSTDQGNSFVDMLENMIDRCTREEVSSMLRLPTESGSEGIMCFSHPNMLIQIASLSLQAYREAIAKDKL
jgi:hypothetical protein